MFQYTANRRVCANWDDTQRICPIEKSEEAPCVIRHQKNAVEIGAVDIIKIRIFKWCFPSRRRIYWSGCEIWSEGWPFSYYIRNTGFVAFEGMWALESKKVSGPSMQPLDLLRIVSCTTTKTYVTLSVSSWRLSRRGRNFRTEWTDPVLEVINGMILCEDKSSAYDDIIPLENIWNIAVCSVIYFMTKPPYSSQMRIAFFWSWNSARFCC